MSHIYTKADLKDMIFGTSVQAIASVISDCIVYYIRDPNSLPCVSRTVFESVARLSNTLQVKFTYIHTHIKYKYFLQPNVWRAIDGASTERMKRDNDST